MNAVTSGLGCMILNAQRTFRTELIFAGIAAIGLLADQLKALLPHAKRFYAGDMDPAEHQPFHRSGSMT